MEFTFERRIPQITDNRSVMVNSYDPPRLRAATACVACNKKKVRCIFERNSNKCGNCLRHQWPCCQRQSKRRGRQPTASRPNRDEHSRDTAVSISPSSLASGAYAPHEPQDITPPATAWPSNPATPWREAYTRTVPRNLESNRNPYMSITAPCGFMERNDYFRDTDPITNDEGALPISLAEGPSDDDVHLLRLQRAFDIPPRAVRESLIDVFMTRCAPWIPVVERAWLEDSDINKPSILLLQSVFVAASRVTSAPAVAAYASSHEFYRRAKALFYSGWEKNPLTVIAAVCILHWYNPECPEHVSTNTSGFWRYVGVGLAHQIGLHKEPPMEGKALRRRLWWSLFARDCLISAGQGRPLAVNLCDSELQPPCVEDFRDSSLRPELFMTYVEICSVLGHLTQSCRRDSLTRRARQSVCRSLQRWIHGLPESLCLFHDANLRDGTLSERRSLSPYDFEARQLHVPYFICLIILCRPSLAHQPPSAAAIFASAYVVAIFEDFLARDEMQYLGSIFTFYLLAAGIGLLSCRRVPLLWSSAESGMETIYASLEQLARRWPSAMAPLRVLRTIADKQVSRPGDNSMVPVPTLPDEHVAFFDTFGPGLTWAWEELMRPMPQHKSTRTEVESLRGQLGDVGVPSMVSPRLREDAPIVTNTLPTQSILLDPTGDFSDLNIQQSVDDGIFQLQYEGIGDWLLNDCDVYGDIMM
ncbi:fungal-specific transcription factor domain-containing protein [Aspergillus varians]